MKKGAIPLLLMLLYLNCPKKYKPELEKIEVYNVGYIYADVLRDKPALAGIKNLNGLSIASARTEPAFLQVLMARIGLGEILSLTGIDYVIGDVNVLHSEGMSYYVISDRMGYGISNINGIRFAMFYPGEKDLSISDNVEIALVKERSDIMWLISEDEVRHGSRRIDFYVQNRGLADTSWSAYAVVPDSVITARIAAFRQYLTQVLNHKFSLDNKSLNAFVLDRISANEVVNVVLYPDQLLVDSKNYDSLSIIEFIQQVDCGMRFKTTLHLTARQVDSIVTANNYKSRGKIKKTNNSVAMPDNSGRYLFDIVAPR